MQVLLYLPVANKTQDIVVCGDVATGLADRSNSKLLTTTTNNDFCPQANK
jgi:hypothetical protein